MHIYSSYQYYIMNEIYKKLSYILEYLNINIKVNLQIFIVIFKWFITNKILKIYLNDFSNKTIELIIQCYIDIYIFKYIFIFTKEYQLINSLIIHIFHYLILMAKYMISNLLHLKSKLNS